MAGASVPQATFTPSSMARLMGALARGNPSAALACSSGAARATAQAVGQVGVGHGDAPPRDNEPQGVLAGQRAVLDAVDAGLDGGPDAVVAVGVGCHPEAGPMGLVDDDPQLLVGVLLGPRRAGVGHDPARSADLDQLGAVLDPVAHGLAHLAEAVGDALLH